MTYFMASVSQNITTFPRFIPDNPRGIYFDGEGSGMKLQHFILLEHAPAGGELAENGELAFRYQKAVLSALVGQGLLTQQEAAACLAELERSTGRRKKW